MNDPIPAFGLLQPNESSVSTHPTHVYVCVYFPFCLHTLVWGLPLLYFFLLPKPKGAQKFTVFLLSNAWGVYTSILFHLQTSLLGSLKVTHLLLFSHPHHVFVRQQEKRKPKQATNISRENIHIFCNNLLHKKKCFVHNY